MLELADIFRLYGPAYLAKHGAAMLPSHLRAMQDIVDCRTAALGGQVFVCSCCGHQVYAYRSCRNRSCPKCHTKDTEKWIAARRSELLPVPYFHLVFTVPEELRDIIRSNQIDLYAILLKAAGKALIKLAKDKQYLGGLPAVMAVLQTWTGTMEYHPHVHCLVPAGVLSPDRQTWIPAHPNFLLPVRALSKLFKGLFGDLLRKRRPDLATDPRCWRKSWVVYCQPAVQGTDDVLDYLGRYIHRVAITNSRILSIADGIVTFRYKDHQANALKTTSLQAEEFIRRFLQHVLPDNFHKVRYFGLWHPHYRQVLHRLQLLLTRPSRAPATPAALDPSDPQPSSSSLHARSCPACRLGILYLAAILPPHKPRPP